MDGKDGAKGDPDYPIDNSYEDNETGKKGKHPKQNGERGRLRNINENSHVKSRETKTPEEDQNTLEVRGSGINGILRAFEDLPRYSGILKDNLEDTIEAFETNVRSRRMPKRNRPSQ